MKTIENIDRYLKEKKSQLYILYGIREWGEQRGPGSPFKTKSEKEEVALFTDMKKAKQFINKYKLKKRISGQYGSGDKIFKNKSPMDGYSDYEIESYINPLPLEIDPI